MVASTPVCCDYLQEEEGSEEDESGGSQDEGDDDQGDLRKNMKKVSDQMRPDLAAGWERLKSLKARSLLSFLRTSHLPYLGPTSFLLVRGQRVR